MKFSACTFAILWAAATTAFGQIVISPTPGQVLSASEPFNLTFASQRYFKESSIKISVVTAPAGGAFPGGAPVLDLAPTSHSSVDTSAIYSVLVTPITLYQGPATGNHTVYVIETYNAFGGLPGIDMFAVPVIFN
ncbi:hypothetical protein C8F04DRAFT_639491 [Mycena alexandri]|uniref:Uncharacterized protein n=1 Tax=Mycena alexandri TaxID=1745969 RepID=A0AAD6SSZ2_9AGAR|nr:hypothetical protein C8F04DRAFT_639491 [Mycena alexandri]